MLACSASAHTAQAIIHVQCSVFKMRLDLTRAPRWPCMCRNNTSASSRHRLAFGVVELQEETTRGCVVERGHEIHFRHRFEALVRRRLAKSAHGAERA